MKSTFLVLKELFNFKGLLLKLAVFEVRANNEDNFLGYAWEMFGPFIQIFVYWFIFGMGLRNGAPVNGDPYIAWLICGYAPWLFISRCISQGLGSVLGRVNLVSKMNFPTSILPAMPMFSSWITFATLVALMLITLLLSGIQPSKEWLGAIYYTFCMFVFLYALNIFNSTIVVLFRDYRAFFSSIMRILFLATPIMWVSSSFNPELLGIMQLNPFYYIIEGFRSAFLPGVGPLDSSLAIYFWSITILLLVAGSILHIKYRDRFVDFL